MVKMAVFKMDTMKIHKSKKHEFIQLKFWLLQINKIFHKIYVFEGNKQDEIT